MSLLYASVLPTVFDGRFRQNGELTVADMSDCPATVNFNRSNLHRQGFCHLILARSGTQHGLVRTPIGFETYFEVR